MATLLYRLGRWCARHRWTVIGAWVALLAIVTAGALTFMKPLNNNISIPGSRFETVLNTLKEEIPGSRPRPDAFRAFEAPRVEEVS